jgi:predicted nucleotidyltransferase
MSSGLEDRLASYFEEHVTGIAAAYLFGSESTGRATGSSDVDVAVLFDQPPAPLLNGPAAALQDGLERCLGRPVDLVVLNEAPADLVHRVLRDGVLLVDCNRSSRIRFEVARRNEYFDLESVRRTYRKRQVPR